MAQRIEPLALAPLFGQAWVRTHSPGNLSDMLHRARWSESSCYGQHAWIQLEANLKGIYSATLGFPRPSQERGIQGRLRSDKMHAIHGNMAVHYSRALQTSTMLWAQRLFAITTHVGGGATFNLEVWKGVKISIITMPQQESFDT